MKNLGYAKLNGKKSLDFSEETCKKRWVKIYTEVS